MYLLYFLISGKKSIFVVLSSPIIRTMKEVEQDNSIGHIGKLDLT
ncbi:hypothetical protein ING2E5A_1461 [Petrimonas mucosa]|jgi:hypothetical protein|uniref:Uncharacterized protein n=1 Tax=Petrimonas mucosa TaxID=1642646 RepID=A0A1G4G6X9_9BACT|nr:hypothetical protein ING2E5A_1461 [Petrimonas mucosa]SFU63772.1 hypothetical protein SAMN05216364_104415 [Porphyromonadaceae bacterium KHP3R9]